jgi:hypothetical protein
MDTPGLCERCDEASNNCECQIEGVHNSLHTWPHLVRQELPVFGPPSPLAERWSRENVMKAILSARVHLALSVFNFSVPLLCWMLSSLILPCHKK